MQIDACRDGFDRRQIDEIVGEDVRLVGRRQHRAAGAALGVDLARHVGIWAQRTRDARPAFAALLLGRRFRAIGFLPLRGRHGRVRRRLRRLTVARLKSRNAHEEHTDLLLQRLVLREQFQHQQLQAVLVERIECFRRHPGLESAPRDAFNAESPSQTDADG